MCGGKDRFQFTDRDGGGSWHCRGCGDNGEGGQSNGFGLVMRIKRIGFKEAARLIESVLGTSAKTSSSANNTKPCDPLKPWRNANPSIWGTPAHTYLARRRVPPTSVEALSLRFRPRHFHWPSKTTWPCMIALVASADGTERAAHMTFLEEDGSAKARPLGEKARLFPAGAPIMGNGVWFGALDPSLEFLVGEGIESTLSAMRIYGAESLTLTWKTLSSAASPSIFWLKRRGGVLNCWGRC
jgi:putative DNA primase/helicase